MAGSTYACYSIVERRLRRLRLGAEEAIHGEGGPAESNVWFVCALEDGRFMLG
jgi:hypothetical protein